MADNKTYAVFQTNRGDFTVELFCRQGTDYGRKFCKFGKIRFL